jgi:(2Fe-2S) ferredoxin
VERGHEGVIVTECLNACDQSNVLVVRRRGPGSPQTFWLGRILSAEDTDRVTAWLQTDGPLPKALEPNQFVPADESRVCLAALELGR